MEKIKMTTPLVEMDGDEMAAILWKETREKLVLPFVLPVQPVSTSPAPMRVLLRASLLP